jgi:hypothetical protein
MRMAVGGSRQARTGGTAAMDDTRWLVCGIATSFLDAPSRDWDVSGWKPWQLKAFVDSGRNVPLRLDHAPVVTTRGLVRDIGTTVKFASLDVGLLALASVTPSRVGFELLHQLHHEYEQWGMSFGAMIFDGEVEPFELSLTYRPADPYARVLGTGEFAQEAWDRLVDPDPSRVLTTHVYPVEAGV